MTSESVIWTLLPNGIDRDTGELCSTIFVSPRLRTDLPPQDRTPEKFPALDAFPTFRHWAAALSGLTFAAEFDDGLPPGPGDSPGAHLELKPDPKRIAAPDPGLWDLLFSGDVRVADAEVRDLSRRRLFSYPADVVARHVLDLYAEVGSQHPLEHPSVTAPVLSDLARDIGSIGDDPRGQGLYRDLDRWFGADPTRGDRPGRFIPASVFAADRQASFVLANRFYDRYKGTERLRTLDRGGKVDPSRVPPGPKRPFLDFHRYIASFGDYPELMRRLGLAIDVRMPADPAIAKLQRYRVVVRGEAPEWMNAPTATPWMNYLWYSKMFLPRTRPGGRHDVKDGQLLLNSDFYALHQIDIDGSALKTTHVAGTIARRLTLINRQGATMAPTTSSLPALRGGALTVIRRNAAASVAGQFDQTARLADDERGGQRTDLWADDVIRGFRYEAERDADGGFRSLVDRVGTYRFHQPDGTIVPLDLGRDQGYVKGSSTSSVCYDEDDPDRDKADLYLHEAIASWSGWSMVTPRPGGGVDTQEAVDHGQTPLERDPGMPLETSFTATPGSLPRLRYGSSYRLRARTVDLAGNSVDPDLIDDAHASHPVTFRRWEPVPAPVVVPRRIRLDDNGNPVLDALQKPQPGYGEGESQMRMVIRSTAGMTVGDYVALPRIQGMLNASNLPYLPLDDRWVVAPSTSQQMAEWHGMFDGAIGSGDPARIAAAYEIACRSTEILPNIVTAGSLAIPYLPDVSSRGVRFNRFPADPAVFRRIDWPTETGAWWDRQPIRVVTTEGPAAGPVTPAGNPVAPKWDATTRTLSVHVPQAEMFTVRISSAVDAADLDIQGMYGPILSRAAADADQRRHEALESRNWMLTPWVELTFVHAVEKPLADPKVAVANAGMKRQAGETFCVLQGAIANHAKSTGRLDIEATWTEQIDDVTEDLPADGVSGELRPALRSHVGDFLIQAFEDGALVGRDDVTTQTGKNNTHRLRHEFGDTRHRVVEYRAQATTRFREYFAPEVIDGVDGKTGESLIKRTGPATTLIVPSSRRPDPPDIAYIIPTFRWTDDPVPNTGGGGPLHGFLPATRRTRHGGGVRVYLKRPWYSSGDGEQLGVVLQDQPWITWAADQHLGMAVEKADQLTADNFLAAAAKGGRVKLDGPESLPIAARFLRGIGLTDAQISGREKFSVRSGEFHGFGGITGLFTSPELTHLLGPNLDKWLTTVGADPVFASGVVPTDGPYIHQFPLRASVRGGVTLAEKESATVTVVGHTPKFDPTRKLWYCDIDMDPGSSYQPFVRLALCRYQPHSVDGCHISRVVRADFAQLLPDRTATLTPMVDGRSMIALRGPSGFGWLGYDLSTVGRLLLTRVVTATWQRLNAGDDPDLGWTAVSEPVGLIAAVGASGMPDVTWSAVLPAATRHPGGTYRVLLQEFEVHPTDDGDTDDPFGAQAVWGDHGEAKKKYWRNRRRLVYADTFSL